MTPTRNPGLDTLRAAAIALVFMYHYMCFVSGQPTFGWLSVVGWTGVDLFFVLSGYLIANPLLAGIARGERVSLSGFYARRALRTLPVFWLVLAAFAAFPQALGGRPPPPWWRFLTFTQNIGLSSGTAFSHAWSLCVEEQFYLVLPVVLVLGAWFARTWTGRLTRVHGWLLIAALAALGVATRILLWQRHGAAGHEQDYMRWIYYATPCRFDEFLPGVALAMLKNFHRPAWARLTARGDLVSAIGVVAVVAALAAVKVAYYVDGVGYGFFMTAFGYSLIAWVFALLVLAALSPSARLLRRPVPGAASLALWSYSIYLSHRPLANVIRDQLSPWNVSEGTRAALVTLACIAGGALLHKLVEAPFLALRDRLVPSNFRRDGARPAGAAVTP